MFVCFGDSLTHNDLLPAYNQKPADLFGTDPHEAVFDKAAAAGDDLLSLAVAGSWTGDVLLQIDLYVFLSRIGAIEAATVFGLEMGGNNFLGNASLLASAPPGADPAADAVVDTVIADWRTAVLRLSQESPSGLIAWTIPDITLTPEYYGTWSAAEEDNIRAHLERANRFIRRLDTWPGVVILDTGAFLADSIASPPEFFGVALDPPPDFCDYPDLFADEIHPTAVANALLANEIIGLLNLEFNDQIPLYSDEELADLAHIPHP